MGRRQRARAWFDAAMRAVAGWSRHLSGIVSATSLPAWPGVVLGSVRLTDRSETRDDAAVRRGDPAEFHRLIVPHLEAAYSLARFLSRDPDAAQDIVQEAALRAFRSLHGFRGGEARVWLLAIVRNCHRDWLAARRRTARFEVSADSRGDSWGDEAGDDSRLSEVASDEDTPEGSLLRRQEADAVRATLMGLPGPLREILVLREIELLSYRDIATVAGIPIGTVMSRLARARTVFAAAWSADQGASQRP